MLEIENLQFLDVFQDNKIHECISFSLFSDYICISDNSPDEGAKDLDCYYGVDCKSSTSTINFKQCYTGPK